MTNDSFTNQFKEKILSTIYKKLCKEFKTNFFPLNQFEKGLSASSGVLLEALESLTKAYEQLKNSEIDGERSQVIRLSKEDYILKEFNSNLAQSYFNYSPSPQYSIDNLEELKSKYPSKYDEHLNQYDKDFKNDKSEIVVPLIEFVKTKASSYYRLDRQETYSEDLSITNLFWKFFHSKYLEEKWDYQLETEEIQKFPERIIQRFKEYYLSNRYLKFLDASDKYLSDEAFSGFEEYIVNVGKRSCEIERGGWIKNKCEVINNGKEYTFSYSTKDDVMVEGKFANVFILQKTHLVKISIFFNAKPERVLYNIFRDLEKITLRDDCEIVIAKHHGNEIIVLNTRKEALALQTKLSEIREGRRYK